jgi:hypothetical protein
MRKSILKITLAAALLTATAAASVAQEAQLIDVLRSSATQKEKADACRGLARVATKEAVPALAALLGDEKLAHMARGALETIADPAADEALRDALGKLKGRPLLGVIGSIGVRRDAKAVAAMAKLLADADVAPAPRRPPRLSTPRWPAHRPPTWPRFAKASSAAPRHSRPMGKARNRWRSTTAFAAWRRLRNKSAARPCVARSLPDERKASP